MDTLPTGTNANMQMPSSISTNSSSLPQQQQQPQVHAIPSGLNFVPNPAQFSTMMPLMEFLSSPSQQATNHMFQVNNSNLPGYFNQVQGSTERNNTNQIAAFYAAQAAQQQQQPTHLFASQPMPTGLPAPPHAAALFAIQQQQTPQPYGLKSVEHFRFGSLQPAPGKKKPLNGTSKTNLYIAGLAEHVTDAMVNRLVQSVIQPKSCKALTHDGKCSGTGFIDCHSEEDALKAKEHIDALFRNFYESSVDNNNVSKVEEGGSGENGKHEENGVEKAKSQPDTSTFDLASLVGDGRKLEVKFAYENEKDMFNVYVRHLPKEGFSEDQLRQLFTQFGAVVSVKLLEGQHDGGLTGAGFVRFHNMEDTRSAIENMNQQSLTLPGCQYPVRCKLADKTDRRVNRNGNNSGQQSNHHHNTSNHQHHSSKSGSGTEHQHHNKSFGSAQSAMFNNVPLLPPAYAPPQGFPAPYLTQGANPAVLPMDVFPATSQMYSPQNRNVLRGGHIPAQVTGVSAAGPYCDPNTMAVLHAAMQGMTLSGAAPPTGSAGNPTALFQAPPMLMSQGYYPQPGAGPAGMEDTSAFVPALMQQQPFLMSLQQQQFSPRKPSSPSMAMSVNNVAK